MCKDRENKEGQGVEERLGRTTRYMEEVKRIGASMKKEDLLLVKRRVMQIVAELEDIRDILLDSVKDSLSPRQLSVLDNEEEELETDPSVQFLDAIASLEIPYIQVTPSLRHRVLIIF